jgi:glucose/arabinose dehydrogenase
MYAPHRTAYAFLAAASLPLLLAASACSSSTDTALSPSAPAEARAPKPPPLASCDADNGGITLAAGFCATIFADNLGAARHIAVRPNGDVYVAIASRGTSTGAVMGLRDTDGDGRADQRSQFGNSGGNGIAYLDPYLYFAQDDRVLRYQFNGKNLGPVNGASTVISGLPSQVEHVTKTIAFRDGTLMYLNIGSGSNSCQVANRQAGSPGIDPCPELATRAGVWALDPRVLGQTPSSAGVQRFATGLRNMVALATDASGQLFGVQMDRDNLNENWPALYTTADDARLPAEELLRLDQGADYGWPYCYYDATRSAKVLAPEYGGDGATVGRCASARGPLLTLPAHWAPLSMIFYRGTAFPSHYQSGAFVAFHGDYFWGTRPRSDSPGYNVVFVPFTGGAPAGTWEVFASGFPGTSAVSRATAAYRPTGLAVGPDGALYVSEDVRGRVWRIVYRGG